MPSLSPSQIDESTTNAFTISDLNSGSNYYYDVYIDATAYGTISSFNGLNKTFTFQSNININFGGASAVTQSISYKIYVDYPVLAVSPTVHTITFTIININNLPNEFIKITDGSSTEYVDNTGQVDAAVNEDYTLTANISGITDTDISGGGAISGGTYQWWKSTNSIVNILTISNYESYTPITGETTSTILLTQSLVGYYLYVTYKYNDGSYDNIAYSGKTGSVVNVADVPTGIFFITDSTNGSSPIIDTALYKYFIVGETDGKLYVKNTILDEDVSATIIVANNANIQKQYTWYKSSTLKSGENNSYYTIVDDDKDSQISVKYIYIDTFSVSTTIEHDNANRQAKTPTILRAFTSSAIIATLYSHALSTVEIIDVDDAALDISLVYVSGSNNTWLSISEASNIYTLSGTPTTADTIGPNLFTLQFKKSGTLIYSYDFTIIVGPLSAIPTLISIAGDMSSTQLNGVRKITRKVNNFTSNSISAENSTFGPVQSSKLFTNTLIVSDTNTYYNTTKYESTKMKLTFTPSSISTWLSVSLNRTQTVTENSALSMTDANIFGDNTNGYYFSTDTAFNTSITPYKWVFDFSGTPPDTNLQTYTIVSTLSDVQDISTLSFNFYLIVESFRYFLPDNISTPVQGSHFEKFMFVTSSKSQNNISMIVKKNRLG